MGNAVAKPPSARPTGMKDADVEFLLTQSERALDAQWESADRLSNRASTLIGVGVSILTGVLVVAATSVTSFIPKWVIVASAIFVLGSAISASAAYAVRRANYPPNPTRMVQDVSSTTLDYRWLLLTNVASAQDDDYHHNHTRSRLVNLSLCLFVVSISIIILGVAVYLS
jgi:multisubunit Na+/H+ antiporter MnhG subunit